MRKRSIDNCLGAADVYQSAAELTADVPAAASLRLKAADALCCAMRIRGNGNILMLEGTLDTPSNKKFWGAHGPRALELVRAARAAHPPLRADPHATAVEMDAFMYASSSKGILRQAVTGAGTEYLKLANGLLQHKEWDGAVAYGYLGGFYAVAPWPLGDRKRALSEFEAAYTAHSSSRRNAYYVCLLRFQVRYGRRAAAPPSPIPAPARRASALPD